MKIETKPSWIWPCAWFLKYIIQVTELMLLANRGIRYVAGFPDVLEALAGAAGNLEQEADGQHLSEAKNMATLAESEISNDFPLLRSHAIMGLWGALEAMIEDLAISWMEYNPDVLKELKIAKIRVPFGEFQNMEQQDRLRFLVTELQRDLGVDLKAGASKFESFLGTLGLGGPVDKRVRDVLFETQNIRNVIAHRGGIVDRRFVTNCPHLQYSIGDTLKVNAKDFDRISIGLLMYTLTVLNRCRVIEGLKPVIREAPGFEGALLFPSNADAE